MACCLVRPGWRSSGRSRTFRIAEGFVTEIEGGEQADLLAELLARQDDAWVYNLARFAFGLNPACTEFTGEMLNDERVLAGGEIVIAP